MPLNVDNLLLKSMQEIKNDVNSEYNRLNTYRTTTLPGEIQNARTQFVKYTKSAGLAETPLNTINNLNSKLAEYKDFNKSVGSLISKLAKQKDIGGKVTELGQIKSRIQSLKVQKKQLEEDTESAQLRKDSVEKREQNVSYYQLFGGFTRPLKIISIPILIALTIFFLSITSFLIYYIFNKNGQISMNIGSSNIKDNSKNIIKNLGLKQI
jgi:hypothetical protein